MLLITYATFLSLALLMCASETQEVRRSVRYPGSGTPDSCEPRVGAENQANTSRRASSALKPLSLLTSSPILFGPVANEIPSIVSHCGGQGVSSYLTEEIQTGSTDECCKQEVSLQR